MTIRLQDTLTGAVRPLEPIEPGRVGVYSCGPTVYGPAHVGNFRSFLFADLLVRYLRYRGLTVTWVMNLTDIDDKIIKGAAAEGITTVELADRYASRFLADADAVGMTRPDALPRATDHIPQIVALVQTLLDTGHAYRTDDGSIFFRIASWPAYGRLARLDPDAMRVGERVEADEYGKDDVRDFALWKGPKPGEPSWDTAIGPGRPGWHIECSAMSMAHLGPSFDIHTGGVDLVFPHHEDEIAQSEAATGRPFVGTWLHCAHLRMDGEKMAKSAGNIARVGELVDAGISPRALRYALISVHYRAPLNFSDESLAAAGAAVERIDAVLAALAAYREDRDDDPSLPAALDAVRAGFDGGLDDDLNVSAALGALFEGIRDLNRRIDARALSTADAGRATALLRELDTVLGVAAPAEATLDPALQAIAGRARGRASRPRLGRVGPAAGRAAGPRCRRRGHARRPALATAGDLRWLTGASRVTTTGRRRRGGSREGADGPPAEGRSGASASRTTPAAVGRRARGLAARPPVARVRRATRRQDPVATRDARPSSGPWPRGGGSRPEQRGPGDERRGTGFRGAPEPGRSRPRTSLRGARRPARSADPAPVGHRPAPRGTAVLPRVPARPAGIPAPASWLALWPARLPPGSPGSPTGSAGVPLRPAGSPPGARGVPARTARPPPRQWGTAPGRTRLSSRCHVGSVAWAAAARRSMRRRSGRWSHSPRPLRWPRTRRSWRAGVPSRRRSSRGVTPVACWSSRSAAAPSRSSCSTRRASASRWSRSRAGP